MIEIDHIYNMDCLEGMKGIPDGSVDMVLCDLPYGTTRCKWDTIIPFEPLWAHYKRIIKPRGAVVLTGSQPFTSALVMSNLDWFRYEWIWEKSISTGFLDANRKPLKKHENILVFSRNGCTYNPIMKDGEIHRRGRKFRTTISDIYGTYKDNPYLSNQYYPVTIIKTISDKERHQTFRFCNNRQERHPTQKPVSLFEYLIKTYTNDGETVMDNCIGSGTTAIACLNTGRHYIGFELDQHYYEIALERIRNNPQRLL